MESPNQPLSAAPISRVLLLCLLFFSACFSARAADPTPPPAGVPGYFCYTKFIFSSHTLVSQESVDSLSCMNLCETTDNCALFAVLVSPDLSGCFVKSSQAITATDNYKAEDERIVIGCVRPEYAGIVAEIVPQDLWLSPLPPTTPPAFWLADYFCYKDYYFSGYILLTHDSDDPQTCMNLCKSTKQCAMFDVNIYSGCNVRDIQAITATDSSEYPSTFIGCVPPEYAALVAEIVPQNLWLTPLPSPFPPPPPAPSP